MTHSDNTSNLNPEEADFYDLIRHGDDFMKIQIYRSARECYRLALEKNIGNELAAAKLAECNALVKSESKTIILIVGIMAVAAAVLFLI